jgi:hypothetical protein
VSLAVDNVVQENSGQTSTTGTSFDVTLLAGTTAGNTVIVFVSYSTVAVPPAGMSTDKTVSTGRVCRKSDVAAGETTWTFTFTNAGTNFLFTWYVVEMTNVDPVEPLDASASASVGVANGQTASTGTTPLNAGLSTVVFGAWIAEQSDATWDSYTNGFEEIAELTNGTGSGWPLSVARKFVDGSTGTFESTATVATSQGSQVAFAFIVAYRAADAPIAAPLALFAGFEWGTHGGLGTGGAISLLGGALGAQGTFGTNYLVQASSARNGGYGFRVVQSASLAGAIFGTFSYAAPSVGFNVRVVSATGTPVVAWIDTNGTDLKLVYDVSTTKFGLQWGSGTVSYQSGTTALNTWVWVDIRLRTNSSTHHADWRIETAANTYTDQTSPADLTGQSTGVTSSRLVLAGHLSFSQTVTVDFDDLIVSYYYVAYPLGPHVVRLLVPETTGASVSGTAANFNQFTANGTLAAFASTNGALLDDVPPTVSASSDGVVQVAVAASDYMQFPMTTYTCSSQEIIAAVRMVAAMWGGTGTGTGTLGLRGWDGTTETTLVAVGTSYDADSLTAISATYPLWNCAMWPSGVGWTQAELDGAALRVGFSTDATPDMGVSALYLEVATRPAIIARQITMGDADEFTADIRLNPYNSASISYLLGSTHATLGATFNYSVSGTPQTAVYVSPSSTQEVVVTAASFGDISDVSLEPDAV